MSVKVKDLTRFLLDKSERARIEHRKYAYRRAAFSIQESLGDNTSIASIEDVSGIKYVGPKISKLIKDFLDNPVTVKHTSDKMKQYVAIWDLVIEMILDEISVNVAGSYRRGNKMIGDLDQITAFNEKHKSDDIHIELTNNGTKMIYTDIHNGSNKIHADFKIVPSDSFWSSMLFLTGSYKLNIAMRSKAKSMGLKLNEYGLFDSDGNKVCEDSEYEIFDKLNMTYLEPEDRNYE